MVRDDPNLQKKALPGEIAIRGDLKPDEIKQGDPGVPVYLNHDTPTPPKRLDHLPDPGAGDDDGPTA